MGILKCPQCGMKKFKKEVKEITIDDMKVVVLVCATCGNIMFNANPPTQFKGKRVKENEFGK